MPLLHLLVVLSTLLISCDGFPASNADGNTGPTATIDSGLAVGVATSVDGASATVNKFLGIPFAASPTRLALPETPTPWTSTYPATRYGPACLRQNLPLSTPGAISPATDLLVLPEEYGESEDCLSLNRMGPRYAGV